MASQMTGASEDMSLRPRFAALLDRRPAVDRRERLGPNHPVEQRTVDLLRADPATRAEVAAASRAIQNVAMVPATHGRHDLDLDTATRLYTERLTDPAIDWRYNTIVLFYDGATPVGLVHGRVRALRVEGVEVMLLYMTTFTHPDHRGQGLLGRGMRHITLEYVRQHPLALRRPHYYTALCLSPTTYRFAHRGGPALHPSRDFEPPPLMRAIYETLYDDTDPDGLIAEPRAALIDPEQRAWIERTDDPDVRWFVERNPRYREGFGLPLLVRIALRDFARASVPAARAQVARLLGKRRRR